MIYSSLIPITNNPAGRLRLNSMSDSRREGRDEGGEMAKIMTKEIAYDFYLSWNKSAILKVDILSVLIWFWKLYNEHKISSSSWKGDVRLVVIVIIASSTISCNCAISQFSHSPHHREICFYFHFSFLNNHNDNSRRYDSVIFQSSIAKGYDDDEDDPPLPRRRDCQVFRVDLKQRNYWTLIQRFRIRHDARFLTY